VFELAGGKTLTPALHSQLQIIPELTSLSLHAVFNVRWTQLLWRLAHFQTSLQDLPHSGERPWEKAEDAMASKCDTRTCLLLFSVSSSKPSQDNCWRCRWWCDYLKKWVAVKKLSYTRQTDAPCLLDNEAKALMHVSSLKIPRVIQLFDIITTGQGDTYLVLE